MFEPFGVYLKDLWLSINKIIQLEYFLVVIHFHKLPHDLAYQPQVLVTLYLLLLGELVHDVTQIKIMLVLDMNVVVIVFLMIEWSFILLDGFLIQVLEDKFVHCVNQILLTFEAVAA